MMFGFLVWVTELLLVPFSEMGDAEVVQIWGNFNNFGFTIIKYNVATRFSSIKFRGSYVYV